LGKDGIVLGVWWAYYLLLMLLHRLMHLLMLIINHSILANVMRRVHLHVVLRHVRYHWHLLHLHLSTHVWRDDDVAIVV
jgi:hypothetical protein